LAAVLLLIGYQCVIHLLALRSGDISGWFGAGFAIPRCCGRMLLVLFSVFANVQMLVIDLVLGASSLCRSGLYAFLSRGCDIRLPRPLVVGGGGSSGLPARRVL